MKIKLTTNGTLFTRRLIQEIAPVELNQVVISSYGPFSRLSSHARW